MAILYKSKAGGHRPVALAPGSNPRTTVWVAPPRPSGTQVACRDEDRRRPRRRVLSRAWSRGTPE
eukprot:4177558-Ditylum_brightwellii.AAC.1